ncbi:hypothetical protein BDF19DRAFT_455485 [Syncephalis fuscata]|nr:hypothetical protein BDF19DRAFT_455485 [Syncephalis fuscata]
MNGGDSVNSHMTKSIGPHHHHPHYHHHYDHHNHRGSPSIPQYTTTDSAVSNTGSSSPSGHYHPHPHPHHHHQLLTSSHSSPAPTHAHYRGSSQASSPIPYTRRFSHGSVVTNTNTSTATRYSPYEAAYAHRCSISSTSSTLSLSHHMRQQLTPPSYSSHSLTLSSPQTPNAPFYPPPSATNTELSVYKIKSTSHTDYPSTQYSYGYYPHQQAHHSTASLYNSPRSASTRPNGPVLPPLATAVNTTDTNTTPSAVISVSSSASTPYHPHHHHYYHHHVLHHPLRESPTSDTGYESIVRLPNGNALRSTDPTLVHHSLPLLSHSKSIFPSSHHAAYHHRHTSMDTLSPTATNMVTNTSTPPTDNESVVSANTTSTTNMITSPTAF